MQTYPDTSQQKLLTVLQISQRLDMSRSFIYQELASGRLEHYKLGNIKGRIRVSERQLMDYLDACRKGKQRYTAEKIEVQAPPSVQAMSKALNKALS